MAYEDDLAKVDLFSRLEKSDLTRIGKAVVPRKYSKGDTIVTEGEQAVAFYVVVSGKAEATKDGVSVATFGPGQCFGEMALLDGYPRSSSVVAAEDTECLAMTRWDFNAELNTSPTIAVAMLPVLSKRIRRLQGENIP